MKELLRSSFGPIGCTLCQLVSHAVGRRRLHRGCLFLPSEASIVAHWCDLICRSTQVDTADAAGAGAVARADSGCWALHFFIAAPNVLDDLLLTHPYLIGTFVVAYKDRQVKFSVN